jgi:hypothetical protein
MLSAYARWLAVACPPLLVLGGAAGVLPKTPGRTALVGEQVQGQVKPGVIGGVVRDATTGAPLGGAAVALGPPGQRPIDGPARLLTDGQGRFVFPALRPYSAYVLTVSKAGYLSETFGARSPLGGARRVSVAPGQIVENLNIPLTKYSTLGGRITDSAGNNVAGVFVRLVAVVSIAGRSQLAAGPVSITDDRGVYRLSGAPAGRYLVQVPAAAVTTGNAPRGSGGTAGGRYPTMSSPGADGRQLTYGPTFFGQSTTAEGATQVELSAGQDRLDIDITLTPARAFWVRGRLDVAGEPERLKGALIRLVPHGLESLGDGSEVAAGEPDPDGSFRFERVPPGAYTLVAGRVIQQLELRTEGRGSTLLPRPASTMLGGYSSSRVLTGPSGVWLTTRVVDGPQLWASETVVVSDRDVTDVTLQLRELSKMTGKYQWDSGGPPPGLTFPASIRLEPSDGDVTRGIARSGRPSLAGSSFAIEESRLGTMSWPCFLVYASRWSNGAVSTTVRGRSRCRPVPILRRLS